MKQKKNKILKKNNTIVIYVLIPINNKNNTLKTKFTLVKEFAEVFVKNNPDYNLVSAEQIT